MSHRTKHILVASCTLLATALLIGATLAADTSGTKPARIGPTVKITKGEQCVEPTEEMRRNHMQMILHQRDDTVHRGVRTSKHSLKNCIDCHADPVTDSVLGKDGFCESCHSFAAVSMDCFSCHTHKRDKNAAAPVPAVVPAAANPGAKP